MDAQQRLCKHFTSLKVCIVSALDRRLSELKQDVISVEQSSLEPLQRCEEMIRRESDKADGILAEGETDCCVLDFAFWRLPCWTHKYDLYKIIYIMVVLFQCFHKFSNILVKIFVGTTD